ncbi:MAG: phosphopantothenate/pantothenate synthetase [Candidatus Heimdallarchaeota archaeon]|nr:phosphopantothenate/pantothenate synthetase [Candidatus Heimdallarchaeota archaeon]
MSEIPEDHPRATSLKIRHELIDGLHKKILTEAGLIAHGRGEAYDYLIGEKTHNFALQAISAAAALIFLSKNPVLSINGNTAILCPKDMIEFSNISNTAMEVNLFYRKPGRLEAIATHLKNFGADELLGLDEEYYDSIDELSSFRRIVDRRGIKLADTVIVPLEDGDRTEALKKNNKKVITIDLNPLSRTAQQADITIVDNVIRVFPKLTELFGMISDKAEAQKILDSYDNSIILKQAVDMISNLGKK